MSSIMIINFVIGFSLFMLGVKWGEDHDFKIHDDQEDRRRS